MGRFTDLFQKTSPEPTVEIVSEPIVEIVPEPTVEIVPESIISKNFKNMVYKRKKK